MERINTVAVIGLGYIGLPTAAILATQGIRVVGVDVKPELVEAVSRGELPFVEPDLGMYLAGAVQQGNLTAQLEVPEADAYIVAVPTPFLEDHAPDLSYIRAAGDAIAPKLRGGELIILESTSPPGATRRLARRIYDHRPDLRSDNDKDALHFVHCPERVLPGRIMIELVTNDRIVGGITPLAADRAASLYRTFCKGEILLTDDRTAEMTKLAENSFRDVNIAFANELSMIADRVGVDVWELIALANHHPRVNILRPGPGVGGHCIAVDPWFLVDAAPQDARLVRASRDVNDSKPRWVVGKVVAAVDGIERPTIAALGLAFKADIDDLRESPAIEVVEELANALPCADILAVEPCVKELPAELASTHNVHLAHLDEALSTADFVLVLVDHSAFRANLEAIRAGGRVLDTRGVLR